MDWPGCGGCPSLDGSIIGTMLDMVIITSVILARTWLQSGWNNGLLLPSRREHNTAPFRLTRCPLIVAAPDEPVQTLLNLELEPWYLNSAVARCASECTRQAITTRCSVGLARGQRHVSVRTASAQSGALHSGPDWQAWSPWRHRVRHCTEKWQAHQRGRTQRCKIM